MTRARSWLVMMMATLALAATSCRRPSSCPAGYEEIVVAPDARWCKDRSTGARLYVQLHPGGRQWRQRCTFTKTGLEGPFEAAHPGGQRWIEGRYEVGRLAGRWIQWDAAGNKVAEGEYRDGHLVAGAPVAVAAICTAVPHVE